MFNTISSIQLNSWITAFLVLAFAFLIVKYVLPFIGRVLLVLACGFAILYGAGLHGVSCWTTALRLPKHLALAVWKHTQHKMPVSDVVYFDFADAQFYNTITGNIPWLTMLAYGIQKQSISMRLKMERNEPATDDLPAGLNCNAELILRLGVFEWRGKKHKCLTLDRMTHEVECMVGFDLHVLQCTLQHYAPVVEFILVRTPNTTIEDLSTVNGVYFSGTFNKSQESDDFVIFPASPNVRDFKTYMESVT
jgi:hypothetical protein